MAELKSKETESTKNLTAKVKYIVPSTKYEDGDIVVAVNGKVYQIKRDVEVEIPLFVVKALERSQQQDAVARKFISSKSSN